MVVGFPDDGFCDFGYVGYLWVVALFSFIINLVVCLLYCFVCGIAFNFVLVCCRFCFGLACLLITCCLCFCIMF